MKRVRSGISALTTATLTAALLTVAPWSASAASTPTPQQRAEDAMTADSLPTVQIDSGVVWDQAIVGNTVYAGGAFSQTRPAGAARGQNLTPRSNLLAYDITTGNLLPFNVSVNGTVKAVEASPDGKTLYIGGSFTQVGGKARSNIAAIDVASGTVKDSFKASVGGAFVNGLAVTNSTVYAGGSFSQASGQSRRNLAAFTTAGAVTSWAPTANLQVDDMIVAPQGDRVIVAGRFGTINGAHAKGTASISMASGASLMWAMNQNASTGIINGGDGASGTMGLSTDGTYVYGGTWQHGAESISNCEGNWAADPSTGQLVWMTAGTGDQYAVYGVGSQVYSVGHSHYAEPFGGWPNYNTPDGNHQFSIALTTKAMGTNSAGGYWNNSGKPAPALINWYPSWITGTATGMGQAGWTVEGNGKYMAVGGEFQGVNGQLQQGLVRFATKAVNKPKMGPRLHTNPNNLPNRSWETPSFSAAAGGATISIRPNYDRDDRNLTYQLFRSGTKEPVATTTFSSDPWTRTSQTVTLTDTSAAGWTQYTYTVRAIDGDGNYSDSHPVTGTTGAGGNNNGGGDNGGNNNGGDNGGNNNGGGNGNNAGANAAYKSAVLRDGATLYWPMGSPVWNAAVDQAGSNNGLIGEGPTVTTSSVRGTLPGALYFPGGNGSIASSQRVSNPQTFSIEAWINTSTTVGGLIVGFNANQSGTSGPNDRDIYMRNDGRLSFAVYPNGQKVVTTTKSYNDGRWHHVVATLGSNGQYLYVDGAAVSNTSVRSAETLNGYWRVGGGSLSPDWPAAPSTSQFTGSIDEVAIYGRALSSSQVTSHYNAGR